MTIVFIVDDNSHMQRKNTLPFCFDFNFSNGFSTGNPVIKGYMVYNVELICQRLYVLLNYTVLLFYVRT